ncbi:bacillithiol biosynthesis deacetylase BshB1 [Terrilactibacillus sp. BCM23-1]|uniref:Bacillithiol biosynthesis deacetylase BshB1 n=1 Tax=Terrilactibacillus tamarindi TaxID=2599694 RepID=A0A6N8CRG3_9BACI|nr:bacillithiol biosynthesis deacetylase BshB1 [Terrilactibacillus tamarindi]MTT32631.1 bacillithiol biosynthesis deacetylase BshB1 [Terrilactibacillus tamarindi]
MSERQLDILAFGAHPDDVEIGMGGTLALHAQKGYKVGICDLTKADLSSNGNVELRQKEAKRASVALNLRVRENCGFPDRGLQFTEEKCAVIVDIIREYQPKVIFVPYDKDRHPDHGDCGHLVDQAYFSAGIKKYTANLNLPSFRPKELYYYFINGFHNPDFVVNISDVYEKKLAALGAYESQFEPANGVDTPLTNGYIETVKSRDRLFGKEINVTYAEGFITKRPLTLGDIVGGHV